MSDAVVDTEKRTTRLVGGVVYVVVAGLVMWATFALLNNCMQSRAETGAVVVLVDEAWRPVRCWSVYGNNVDHTSAAVSWPASGTWGDNTVYVEGRTITVEFTHNKKQQAFRELGLTEDECDHLERARYDVDAGAYR